MTTFLFSFFPLLTWGFINEALRAVLRGGFRVPRCFSHGFEAILVIVKGTQGRRRRTSHRHEEQDNQYDVDGKSDQGEFDCGAADGLRLVRVGEVRDQDPCDAAQKSERKSPELLAAGQAGSGHRVVGIDRLRRDWIVHIPSFPKGMRGKQSNCLPLIIPLDTIWLPHNQSIYNRW